MNSEYVLLVTPEDRVIGTMEKLQAHQEGQLHRAFSVFVFNAKGELLLQQRANEKYHSGGLWTNTCCSHPRMGESYLAAGHRRMVEEMGMDCELFTGDQIIYDFAFDNGLHEHELDMLIFGQSDTVPQPAATEVQDYRYATLAEIQQDIRHAPQQYTEWFKFIFAKLLADYIETPKQIFELIRDEDDRIVVND